MNNLTEPIENPAARGKSANPYRILFKKSAFSILVIRIGADGTIGPIVEANDRACEVSGYSRDELIGMNPASLTSGGADWEGGLKTLLATGQLVKEETVVLRDGRRMPIEMVAHMTEFDNEPAVMVICRDTTRGREVERALCESEERFRCIFDQAPVGMALADSEGQLLLVNRALMDMLGHGLGTLLWRRIHDLACEEDRPAEKAQYERLCHGEIAGFNQEVRFVRVDGGRVWVRLTCSAVHSNGLLVHIIAIIENISQEKESQALLAAEHEAVDVERRRLRTVLDLLPVGVFISDAEGRLIEINQAGHAIWSAQESLGNWPNEFAELYRAWDAKTGERRNPADCGLMRALRHGEVIEAEELDIEAEAGARKRIMAYSMPIHDQSGRIMGAASVYIDITHNVEVTKQLRELNETLEQRVLERTAVAEQRATQLRSLAFELTRAEQRERRRIAQMLHDHHQQLLVAAKLSLSMLHRRVPKPELHPIFKRIVELLDQSIDGLRSLTVELSPTILHDAGLCAALEWLGRHKKFKYNLDVAVDVDQKAEPQSEEIRIFVFQAVRELLFNIVKHAQVSKAAISLKAENEEFSVITVSDNGVGFDRTKILPRGGNEGFGLFSLRERLEMVGGRVNIESEPGKGTRVTLIVPRADANTTPAATVAMENLDLKDLPKGEGRTRVLLVDDHEILREGMVALLHEYPDIEVIAEASDGILAIEMARHTNPDVVIMDVAMPRLDGIEATRRIKAANPAIQIIGLSMYGEENMADTMRTAGAAAYLPKGCPADLLISTIRRCASNKQLCA